MCGAQESGEDPEWLTALASQTSRKSHPRIVIKSAVVSEGEREKSKKKK
jgi:hypothetical protein